MEAYARKRIQAPRDGKGPDEVTVANGIVIRKYRGRGGKSASAAKGAAREMLQGLALGALAAAELSVAVLASEAGARAGHGMPAEYQDYCVEAGEECNICPELLMAVIEAESGGDPDAVGKAGEIGPMQIYPKFHRARMQHLDVYDLYDPEGNILVGADYLAELCRRYGDVGVALMAYNGTEGAEVLGQDGILTPYAQGILERAAELERQHGK